MSKLWGGRFNKKTDPLVDKFTSSIGYDYILARFDLISSIAHAKMLGKTKIIPVKDSAKIVEGLKSILNQIEKGKFVFDKKAEDIHTNIQATLEKKIGRVAQKLHTARSRNDQVATDIRMYAKNEIKNLKFKIKNLQSALLDFGKKNISVIIPGFTHLQHAQPVLLTHQLLAYVEMLERDKERLSEAYKRCDVLPLGSGAIAGSSLPIDRKYVARLLGFSKIAENSIDAVSDRDFVVEILADLSILSMHLSRLAEELIIWASPEFSILELDDAFCTGSSLMPQKKNPDVLELVRGSTGNAYGNLIAFLTTMKGLPLAYNRDMQLDKPALFNAAEGTIICLEVLCGLIRTAGINKNQALILCADEFLCATDLAEYLVKKGVAFKEAHEIVGKICALAYGKKIFLSEVPLGEWKKYSARFEKDVYQLLDSSASIKSKRSYGGTSPLSVKRQLSDWKRKLKK
ncbi:MAG: argininosuccinate lyase [Candidatus Omnitrophica bacterium]|nr:argininosuccinate lyase [Candidatus Omnitrophota bacterium]